MISGIVIYHIVEIFYNVQNSKMIHDICSLTKKEKQDREYKKTVLHLAKEHDRARELENIQRYHMPHDKKVCIVVSKLGILQCY